MAGVSATNQTGAIIENGQVVNQAAAEQAAKDKTSVAATSANEQKDQFLQLLVAQMKYQDPLQPTSNTEYISQYATFSSLEAMQNMESTLQMSRAGEMIGKNVTIQHSEVEGGTPKEISGVVDFVKYENNKAYVSVNGTLYKASEVVAVESDNYNAAQTLANQFVEAVDSLPKIYNLTKADAEKVSNLYESFNKIDATTKSLIPSEYATAIQQYMIKAAELLGTDTDGGEATDGTAKVEGSTAAEQAGENASDTENKTSTTDDEEGVTEELLDA